MNAFDVRFATSAGPVIVRITGLAPALAAQAGDHWVATMKPLGDRGTGNPPLLRVAGPGERLTAERSPSDASRPGASGGDLLPLPGGRLLVHPEREVVEAMLGEVAATEDYLHLDVLDAGLAVALSQRRVLLVHGAAFIHHGSGTLAIGDSGTGKSTLAAAAVAAGARVLSDDTVLVHDAGDRLEARPFRNHLGFRQDPTASLPRQSAAKLRRLDGDGWAWWRLDLAALPSRSRAGVLEPRRIWALSVDRRLRRSRCKPLSQSEGLASLVSATSPLVLSPRYRRTRAGLLPLLRRLAEGCPGWHVRLGTDLLRDPAAELERLVAATS